MHLLEGAACERQAEQHLLRLFAVVLHALGDEIVQLILDASGLLKLLGGHLAEDFGASRA